MKPGYRTSEFWFTLVSFIFSGLYLTGILKENAQKEQLIEIVSHAVESCILIGGQLLILYKYINGRTKIKTHMESTNERRTSKSTKRTTNKSRSRKTNTNSKK